MCPALSMASETEICSFCIFCLVSVLYLVGHALLYIIRLMCHTLSACTYSMYVSTQMMVCFDGLGRGRVMGGTRLEV